MNEEVSYDDMKGICASMLSGIEYALTLGDYNAAHQLYVLYQTSLNNLMQLLGQYVENIAPAMDNNG